MLVGQRRRLLNYLREERPRGLPRAHRASSACAASRGHHRPGHAGPGLHPQDARTATTSRRTTCSGTTTVLVFYPFAFSPVCTDQLQVYEEVAAASSREQGATLYGVSTDATLLADGVPREARRLDRAALGLRAQGRDVARVRRLLRAGRHDQPRARDRRPRRRRAAGSYLADSPGRPARASTSSSTRLAARLSAASATVRARKSKIASTSRAHERAVRELAERRRSRSRSGPCRASASRPPPPARTSWVWCQQRVRPADLHVDEAVRRVPVLDRRQPADRDAVQAQPVLEAASRRASRSAPGVTTSKRSSGGVIASRLRASAKNGKTSSGVPARRCSRLQRRGCAMHPTGTVDAAPDARPRAAPRSRRSAPTTTSAAPGDAARRRLRRLHAARAARSPRVALRDAPVRASPSATSR